MLTDDFAHAAAVCVELERDGALLDGVAHLLQRRERRGRHVRLGPAVRALQLLLIHQPPAYHAPTAVMP